MPLAFAQELLVVLGASGTSPALDGGAPDALPRVIARAVKTLSATVAVGAVVTAAWLAPGPSSSRRARVQRVAAAGAGLWALAAVAELVFAASLATGAAPTAASALSFAAQSRPGGALAVQAVVAAVIALVAIAWRTVAAARVGLALALVAFAASVGGGHLSPAGHGDLGAVALFVHIAAATLWTGGLVGALVLSATSDDARGILSRFGRLAGGCAAAVGASGVLIALVAVSPAALVTTPYGLLVLAKAAGFAVALLAAHAARTRLRTATKPLHTVAGVEIAALAATILLGVVLSQSEPPVTGTLATFDPLAAAPSALALLAPVAPSGAALGVAALLAIPYAVAMRTLRRRGDAWPAGRPFSFFGGVALLLLVTCTGLGAYATVLFSAHMVQHMVLNMVVPVLLVFGAPITLALRAVSVGTRRSLLRLMRSGPVRTLTAPVTVTAIFIGSLYLLYFTPLFPFLMARAWGHVAMLVHFLVSGFLFFWMLIGVDPDPHRPAGPARIPLVVAGVVGHTTFAVVLVFGSAVLGAEWYATMRPAWPIDRLTDQQLGGGFAWAIGELAMVGVLVVVVLRWFRTAERADGARARAAARARAGE